MTAILTYANMFSGNLNDLFHRLIISQAYDPADPLFFTHPFFAVFLLLFLAASLLFSAKPAGRTAVLLIFSLWFYYRCSGLYVLLLVAAGLLNFLVAIPLGRATPGLRKTGWLLAGLTVNLAVLAAFKYTPAASLLSGILSGPFRLGALVFPAGISFYTFVNMAYLLDVSKQRTAPCRSLTEYLAFATFFPTVQMGPIERAGEFFPQLKKPLRLSQDDVAEGLFLILSGAIKKVVIGDYLNLHLVSQVFSMPERHTGMEVLAAILGYSLVIFCDFSGYTDMARGIARWMGIRLRLNFNLPYRSANIGEFWNRWHISLSSWLRDYLFLPLAYRLSALVKREHLVAGRFFRTDLAIFAVTALVTFALCGLWHGTGWNFLIWGLMHGAALGIQRGWSYATRAIRRRRTPGRRKAGRVTGIVGTFAFVSVSWIFFRTSSPEQALALFRQIGANFYPEGFPLFLRAYYPVLGVMAAGYLLHFLPENIAGRIRSSLISLPWPWKTLIALAALSLVALFRNMGTAMPIYIQF